MSSITCENIKTLRASQRRLLHEVQADSINARVVKAIAEQGEEWDDKAIAALNKDQDGEFTLDGAISGYDGIRVSDGNTEFIVFKDSDEAEKYATERVKEDLENEPELFSQDWLDGFLSISDTDRRIMAQEQADSYVDDLDVDRVLDEAGMKDERDELQEKKDDLEEKRDDFDAELEELQQELKSNPEQERLDEIKDRINEINQERKTIDADLMGSDMEEITKKKGK